jgi:hypothetical protein
VHPVRKEGDTTQFNRSTILKNSGVKKTLPRGGSLIASSWRIRLCVLFERGVGIPIKNTADSIEKREFDGLLRPFDSNFFQVT